MAVAKLTVNLVGSEFPRGHSLVEEVVKLQEGFVARFRDTEEGVDEGETTGPGPEEASLAREGVSESRGEKREKKWPYPPQFHCETESCRGMIWLVMTEVRM